MKVLKNNYDFRSEENVKVVNPYPKKMVCTKCGSELEYDESDVRVGAYGCAIVDCPLCGQDNVLDGDEKSLTLTANNVEFPVHFHHTSKEGGAVDCFNNDTIKEYIQKGINYLRKYKDEIHYGGHITGNLYIDVTKWTGDESYDVTVSNDFYHTVIPFESEDYEDSGDYEILF